MKKTGQKIYYLGVAQVSLFFTQRTFAVDSLSQDDLKSAIIPSNANDVLSSGTAGEAGESFLDALLAFARDSIFTLLILIAIGMFLFIGGRLVVARGNPEEFKKAMKSFIYAIIGIIVVSLAWALVRLISGIDI